MSTQLHPKQPSRTGGFTDARILGKRFAGYLSADGLNYALGFLIYAVLVRILTNDQYGELSVATTIYQALMMVVALGLDLTGPRLLSLSGGDPQAFIRRAQNLRLTVAIAICAPVHIICAIFAVRHGQTVLAEVLIASFSMVIARALDLTYVAVAFGLPSPLAKTRAFGLAIYLVLLVAFVPILREHLWVIPVVNAIGVTIGRVELARRLRAVPKGSSAGDNLTSRTIILEGARASGGQLLLLLLQTLDIVLLAKYVATNALGQYSIVSRLYLLGTAVLTCVLNTFLPELVEHMNSRDAFGLQFRRYLGTSVLVGVLGCCAFVFLGPTVSELLAHRSLPLVRSISPVFGLVFLLMAVANPFLNLLPTIGHGTAYLLTIAAAASVLLISDFALMPRLGVFGASLGQAIATFALMVITLVCFRRAVNDHSHWAVHNATVAAQA